MKQELEQTLLRAYVLMPFDPEFDKIFEKLIKPTLKEVGYGAQRADSIANQQNILKDVVRGIAEADLVVADLTSLNPNVFYELGISHTMQKPTVLITQSIEDVPFDLRSYRMIRYSRDFSEAPKLSQALKDIGETARSGSIGFGNPVTDFLPQMRVVGLPTTKVKKAVIGAATEKEAEPEEVEEKGLWDFAVDTEKSLKDIAEFIKLMTEETSAITEKMAQHTAEAQKITQSGKLGTAARMQEIATATASDIILYAKKLEEGESKFHGAWESFGESTAGLLQTARIHNEKDKEEGLRFRSQVEALRSAIREALAGVQPYRESVAGLKGISRDINQASRRVTSILDLVISDLEGADSYCTKVITLLTERFGQEV
jgi:hypothetical protein